jgi:hypothetical protein
VVDQDTLFATLIFNGADLPGVECYPRPIMAWTERFYRPVFDGLRPAAQPAAAHRACQGLHGAGSHSAPWRGGPRLAGAASVPGSVSSDGTAWDAVEAEAAFALRENGVWASVGCSFTCLLSLAFSPGKRLLERFHFQNATTLRRSNCSGLMTTK